MRRHVQSPGIRKWAGEDLLDLQSEGLKILDQFFGQYGDMVISGCEVDIDAQTITPGIIGLSGKDHSGKVTYKVCSFKGANNIDVFPVFIALKYTEETREYADAIVRPVVYLYEAELLRVKPEDRPYITLGTDPVLRFTDVIQDNNHRFVSNIEKGKIALIDNLVRMLPSYIDHEPGKNDDSFGVGKLVYTESKEGARTFWRCYDNTRGEAIWIQSDGGSVSAVVENANITITSNQVVPDINLRGLKFKVKFADVEREFVWEGNTVTTQIPTGEIYEVIPSVLNGYKKPGSKIFTAIMTNSRDIVLEYLTTKLTVQVTAESGGDISGVILKIISTDDESVFYDGPAITPEGNPRSVYVPFGQNFLITLTNMVGYVTPKEIVGTANQVDYIYEMFYEKANETRVVFDKSVSDPANITVTDPEIVEEILSKMRRCMTKYLGDNKIAIRYLQNDNSNYYDDGSPSKLTRHEGDVMVYFPEFYYKYEYIDANRFAYKIALENIDGTYIHIPSGLEGAYKVGWYSGVGTSKYFLHSVSGGKPEKHNYYNLSLNAPLRGMGYSFMNYERHCMLALLFCAKFRTTDAAAILGLGGDPTYTGSTDSIGNQCTQNEETTAVNFYGFEGLFGMAYEYLDKIKVVNYEWIIEMRDGSERRFQGVGGEGYIKNILASEGPYFDIIPIDLEGSDSSYYCDYAFLAKGESETIPNFLARSGNSSGDGKKSGIFFTSTKTPNNHTGFASARLSFQGEIIEIESVEEFKALPIKYGD